MRLRLATTDELDRMGLSDPAECSICPGHQCRGCGVPVKHSEGSTCTVCWMIVFLAQQDTE